MWQMSEVLVARFETGSDSGSPNPTVPAANRPG